MRITLAQTESVLGEIDENLERAHEIIRAAGREHSDVVVFPELFLTGYNLGRVDKDVTLSTHDKRLLALGTIAPETDVLIGLYEDGHGVHNYNAAAYLSGGGLVHTHRKLYLPTYDVFEERKHFSPGQTMRAFPTRHGRLATLICNDAWQPHIAFLAVQDGALVLLVPTNSSQSRFPERYDSQTYWRDITIFYARMFQCYVVFCNRVGDEGENLRFWGGSHIVDPWGEIVCTLPFDEEAVVTTDINLASVRKRRREVPLVREAPPILRNQIRPFVRRAQPYVEDLRPAASKLAKAAPDLTTAFGELNRFFNALSFNPAGAGERNRVNPETGNREAPSSSERDEGYLFWLAWAANNSVSLHSTSDAEGVVRRASPAIDCTTASLVGGSEVGKLCLLLTGGTDLPGPLAQRLQQGEGLPDSGEGGALPSLSELLEGLKDGAGAGASSPQKPQVEGSTEGAAPETGAGTTGDATGEDGG